MLPITRMISQYNFTKLKSKVNKFIVVHYTGNKTDKAINNAKYFNACNRGASAHLLVDDTSIIQIVEFSNAAWSVGKLYNKSKARLWGVCTNSNSINIEMCSTNGVITEATKQNTIELVKYLMNEFNIPASNVVRHYDVCGKLCPGWNGWSGSNETIWNDFKNQLSGGATPAPKPAPKPEPTPQPSGNEIIRLGQQHSINFTGHAISVDGVRGPETVKNQIRVLQQALKLDYNAKLDVDGIWGDETQKALGRHYVKRGEKQYMVTAAEILCMMHGIDCNGVECPGIFGGGLERAANASKLTYDWFIMMARN